MGSRAVFFVSDLERCQDAIEQALWDLLNDHHDVDREGGHAALVKAKGLGIDC